VDSSPHCPPIRERLHNRTIIAIQTSKTVQYGSVRYATLYVHGRQENRFAINQGIETPHYPQNRNVPKICHVKVLTNRRLNSRLFRRRLALWASRELSPPSWISAPAPKVVAGRRAIALTVIIVTAKSQQSTRKSASTGEWHLCTPLFRRR